MPGIFVFRNAPRHDAVTQLPDFVFIKIPHRVAEPSRGRVWRRNETVASELVENLRMVRGQAGLSSALYIDRANYAALC